MTDLTGLDKQVVDYLVAFEKDIAAEYDAGHIRAPIHLAGGNEIELINIFKKIDLKKDWVCGTWRTHYHCLLKGVPPAKLKADIISGKSITLCYPEHRVISSAIAGGILPIALGIAWAIRRGGWLEKVWCFVGDMVACGGTFAECTRYANGHQLPITFIVEDNGKSVCTDTAAVWGKSTHALETGMIQGYAYELPWPHSGAGKRINF